MRYGTSSPSYMWPSMKYTSLLPGFLIPLRMCVGQLTAALTFDTASTEWYRYDKHGFIFSAQVTCDLKGVILHVRMGMGHNNDKAMLNMSGMKEYMREHGIKWLADGGYSFQYLVTPDNTMPLSWNNTQKALRSVVETAIGFVKLYRFAAERVAVCPELQELADGLLPVDQHHPEAVSFEAQPNFQH